MYELYALGVLEPEERFVIDEHLARNCDVCTPAVRRAALVNAAILSFVPDAAPPKRLRSRVIAAAGGETSKASWWPAWALGALAAGLAALSFVQFNERQSTATELASVNKKLSVVEADASRSKQILDFLDQPETRAVGFSGAEPVAPPKGNFFVNPKSGVLMIASRLPKLDPGKTYQMWVIPKGKNPLSAGLFLSDDSGAAIHLQPGPVDVANIAAVAVSVEPESGSAQPTTKPIIVAPVGL